MIDQCPVSTGVFFLVNTAFEINRNSNTIQNNPLIPLYIFSYLENLTAEGLKQNTPPTNDELQ